MFWLILLLLLLLRLLVQIFVRDVMMSHTLRFVMSGQSEDQPHHGLKVPLENLFRGDVMHPDPFSGHELKHPIQVVAHALKRFGIVLDSGNLFAS
jgi:hypothetical protein